MKMLGCALSVEKYGRFSDDYTQLAYPGTHTICNNNSVNDGDDK
jgi:hypothetical protein